MKERFATGMLLAGRFRVVELLGKGGMGEVVRAEDLGLAQTVALKFLPAELAADPRALDRVRAEVLSARRVSHPNVCRVHDLGEAGGQLFISMEYVDGEDLATLLRRVGRLAGDRALAVAREICAGLVAAHAAGVIHRDLKPANVMLDRRGRVRITDFGLAQIGEEKSAAFELAGTPTYMAPELLAGMGATVRSDLYALGLVLYELFTGRKDRSNATIAELLRLRRDSTPVSPRHLVKDLDPAAERVILACLAPRPEDRPESALAVLTALSGDDPLKAALDAGQTPSPSAVAAAPLRGALPPAAAWACVAAVVVGLAVYLSLGSRLTVLENVGPSLPPAALAVKAEEAMRALGHASPCADRASGFDYDDGAVNAVAAGGHADIAQLAAARRRMIVFWHRCSPVPLIPLGRTLTVSREDPPAARGEAMAVLDVGGGMLAYQAAPGGEAGAGNGVPPLDAFARAAGVQPVGAVPAPASDGTVTFEAFLETGVPASVEAELRGSRLATARVKAPWTEPQRPKSNAPIEPRDVPDLLVIALILASVPLARRNVKDGRGDREGAKRVGALVFCCWLVVIALGAHYSGTSASVSGVFTGGLARALYFGVTSALLYLALEPFVRRVWPERLVSWTRLLAGDARDPMVARDVLVGVATVYAQLTLCVLLLSASGSGMLVMKKDLAPLLGVPRLLAAMAQSAAGAVRFALVLLLLLLLLRPLGRVRGLPTAVFFTVTAGLLVALFRSLGVLTPVAVALAVVFGSALLFLLVRFGLLATTTLLFFGIYSTLVPDPTRLSGWTVVYTWWLVAFSLAASAYGLFYATGGRPFGDRQLLALEPPAVPPR